MVRGQNPAFWGRCYWEFGQQGVCARVRQNPHQILSVAERTSVVTVFEALTACLPCLYCRQSFLYFWHEFQIPESLTWSTVFLLLYAWHELVNCKLQRPFVGLAAAWDSVCTYASRTEEILGSGNFQLGWCSVPLHPRDHWQGFLFSLIWSLVYTFPADSEVDALSELHLQGSLSEQCSIENAEQLFEHRCEGHVISSPVEDASSKLKFGRQLIQNLHVLFVDATGSNLEDSASLNPSEDSSPGAFSLRWLGYLAKFPIDQVWHTRSQMEEWLLRAIETCWPHTHISLAQVRQFFALTST